MDFPGTWSIDCRKCPEQFDKVYIALSHPQKHHGAKDKQASAKMLRAYPPIKLSSGIIIHTGIL